MAKEKFIEDKMATAHKYVVRQANEIISEYMEAGFTLTLRQLYYQFVARDLIHNTQQEYKRLGKIIDKGRQMGFIDWDAIEDRTRYLRGTRTWSTPTHRMKDAHNDYKLDPWETQKIHIEVWPEKDALIGVVQPACNRHRVDFFACRGYTSQSEAYAAGKRLAAYADAGYRVIVLHLGDHDPSGMQMTDDNRTRLSLFAGREIELRRIALNMPQIDQYNPPPNWAKEEDSRTRWYVEKFETNKSWELDALDPKVIDGLIDAEITPLIDPEKWAAVMEQEAAEREVIAGVRDNWSRVTEKPWLQKRPAEVKAEALALIRAEGDVYIERGKRRLSSLVYDLADQQIESINLESE